MVTNRLQYKKGVIMRKIAVACDHAGYPLKQTVCDVIREAGYEVVDLGTDSESPVDYPDYAFALGQAITSHIAERGVLLCGSGVGACIAANKMNGIYAGVCHDTYSAHQGVEHDRMNVLCIGARVIGIELAREIVKAFIDAVFIPEERHIRRTEKVREIERTAGKQEL
jgi:ribose 5-phosphate isomerase B